MSVRDRDWVPVRTVARALKVSRQRVYKLIEERRIAAESLDGVVLISMRSVQAYELLRRRSKGGI